MHKELVNMMTSQASYEVITLEDDPLFEIEFNIQQICSDPMII
ncbi:228_t:CDS:2 [Funneliformis mosseae]|uniref:228_t:CDS:1 n=1 Tax=Funneliformis mosseae TaxID=27381 RepID=A0A9N9GQR9_FUNMO|nr:228_t:CDS:2 [Funneliformis mosseae]